MNNPKIWGIDVGNTHCKIGVIEGTQVLHVFRFRTEPEQSIDEYYFRWKDICYEIGWEQIPPIWVASVVPSVSIAIERLAQMRNLTVHWVNSSSEFSFQLPNYITKQIGADILILAEAASHLIGRNAIIVSAGTATVVFAIKEGVLLGGAIAPGIKGAVESLIQNAALLNPVFLELPERVVGRNTDEAMKSGILYGFAGLIDGIVTRMKEELGDSAIPVIATGGMIGKIEKISHTIVKVYPDLGIQGIAFLAMKKFHSEKNIGNLENQV